MRYTVKHTRRYSCIRVSVSDTRVHECNVSPIGITAFVFRVVKLIFAFTNASCTLPTLFYLCFLLIFSILHIFFSLFVYSLSLAITSSLFCLDVRFVNLLAHWHDICIYFYYCAINWMLFAGAKFSRNNIWRNAITSFRNVPTFQN